MSGVILPRRSRSELGSDSVGVKAGSQIAEFGVCQDKQHAPLHGVLDRYDKSNMCFTGRML